MILWVLPREATTTRHPSGLEVELWQDIIVGRVHPSNLLRC